MNRDDEEQAQYLAQWAARKAEKKRKRRLLIEKIIRWFTNVK